MSCLEDAAGQLWRSGQVRTSGMACTEAGHVSQDLGRLNVPGLYGACVDEQSLKHLWQELQGSRQMHQTPAVNACSDHKGIRPAYDVPDSMTCIVVC